MKQIELVLDAVADGWDTSEVIANETGLPLHHVSAWLSELERGGLIEQCGTHRPKWRRGPPSRLWRIAPPLVEIDEEELP